jgi:hypothetical protein
MKSRVLGKKLRNDQEDLMKLYPRLWSAEAYLVPVLLLGVALLMASASGVAQTNLATVTGHVTDPSGAIVPNAAIELTNLAQHVSRDTVGNGDGDYEIPYLVPGTYQLTCRVPGFETFVVNDVVILGNETRRVDVEMKVGSTQQQVVVTGGEAVISTENAQVTSGFTQKTYQDSPASLSSVPTAQMVFLPMVQSEQGGFNLTVGGQPPTQIEESMDGVGNDGPYNLVQNVKTTQDLEMITSISPAEFSRAANFTMSGMGGTNAFHGLAQFDEINSALNARFATEPTKPSFKTHFGEGQIGGPIRKDRTFFFFDYTFFVVPASSFSNENVPDALERQGNFSEVTTPVINPYTGTAFAGNIIPTGMISSVASAMQQNYIPLPNQGAPGITPNNYGYFFPHPSDTYKYLNPNVRIDHNFSSKHSLFGSYTDRITPYLLAGSFPNVGTWTRNRYHHVIVVSDTYTITPALVNNFRWGWALDHIHDGIPELGYTPPGGNVAVATIGLQGVNPNGYKIMGFPNTTITGISPLTQQPGGLPVDSNTFTYNDSITWAKGRHVAKFGGEIKPWTNATQQYAAGTYGAFTYDGSITGSPYADFLLGLPKQSSRLNPLVSRTAHGYEMGFYAEDLFKVTPKLTLTGGLRWDFQGFPTYNDGLVYNWNPTTGDVIIPQAAVSKVSPLFPTNITVTAGQAVPSGDKSLFRPRIGAAYRITDTFVIRGGYGMFTQVLGNANGGSPIAETLVTAPTPFSIAETYVNQFTNGQPQFSMPNPFPASLSSATISSQSVTGYSNSIKNGITHEFSLSLEKQIHSYGFAASYVSVRARGLDYRVPQTNLPQPSLIPFTQARTPFPQFISTSFEMANGKSDYDALSLTVKRRVGHFTLDGNYTYANNLDNMENLQNPYNLNPWNHDAYTARNIGTFMLTYALPFGHGQRFGDGMSGPVNAVLGSWHMNWITTLQSGQYFTPSFSGADPSNTNTFGGIPDRICNGNLGRGQRNPSRYFDASCFTVPQEGTFGNSGSNILESARFNITNVTLGKDFPIGETGRYKVTVAALVLDVFNTPTYSYPYSNISVPSQVGQMYAPLGGLNEGGGLVDAGGARAITGRLRFSF